MQHNPMLSEVAGGGVIALLDQAFGGGLVYVSGDD